MALTQVSKDVLNSSQANITQVGTLTNLTVSGNVGINTTAPTERLHVEGNVTISGNVKFTGWHIYESSNNLYFAYNGAVKMSLNTSGNLTVSGDVAGFGTP